MLELAYIAGYFDGEGNVGVHAKRDGPPTARLQIVQKTREPLDAIAASLGFGRVSPRNGDGCYCLTISRAKDILAFEDSVGPFVRQKRRHLSLAAELARLTLEGPRRIAPAVLEERHRIAAELRR